MRPAAYAILAAAVCVAAATLPSTGKSDRPRQRSRRSARASRSRPADLAFILKQIKIAERHSRAFEGNPDPGTPVNPDPIGDPDVLPGARRPEREPDPRPAHAPTACARSTDRATTCSRAGRSSRPRTQPFPRLTTPVFSDAEASPTDFFGPGSGTIPSSSYAQKKGFVFDTQPRLISNLIVDQTSTNPAAVAAAEFPVRTQGNPGVPPARPIPTRRDPAVVGVPPAACPAHKTLFIPNVTTDVGLSPPYNSLFTFFGQFFDHGVDQTVKSGGTVFVPLRADDPLITLGPDGIAGHRRRGSAAGQPFMVLTRAQNQPGPDGVLRPRADPGTARR